MADKKAELAMKKAEELDKELDEHIEFLKKKGGGKKRETGFTEENWEQVSYQTRGWTVYTKSPLMLKNCCNTCGLKTNKSRGLKGHTEGATSQKVGVQ